MVGVHALYQYATVGFHQAFFSHAGRRWRPAAQVLDPLLLSSVYGMYVREASQPLMGSTDSIVASLVRPIFSFLTPRHHAAHNSHARDSQPATTATEEAAAAVGTVVVHLERAQLVARYCSSHMASTFCSPRRRFLISSILCVGYVPHRALRSATATLRRSVEEGGGGGGCGCVCGWGADDGDVLTAGALTACACLVWLMPTVPSLIPYPAAPRSHRRRAGAAAG